MKRFLLINIILLAIFTGFSFSGGLLGWLDPQYIQQTFSRLSVTFVGQIWTAFVIAALLCLDIILPVPSSTLMTLAGKLLGFWAGGAASFVGMMSASAIGYLVCYWAGVRIFRRYISPKEKEKVVAWFKKYGIYAIIISRPIPMLTEILSCSTGLYRFPVRLFLAASILGTLPGCFIYSYFGNRGMLTNSLPVIWLATIFPAAGWLVAALIKSRIVAATKQQPGL